MSTTATFEKDFDALEVGERFQTRARTIGEADITSFASLTGDTHPQHTDAEWAAQSRFGERIAHGLLVLSYAAGLVPFDPDRVVALRKVGDATFKQPVKIGDTVHVEGNVAKARELDDEHGLVECRWKVVNQNGKLVMRANVEVVWRRGETRRLTSEPEASTSERGQAAGERAPAADKRTPAADERAPAADDRSPAADKRSSAADKRSRASSDRDPATNERSSATDERSPAAGERSPAAGEPGSATSEPVLL